MRAIRLLAICGVLLAGCAAGPDYRAPTLAELKVPEHFTAAARATSDEADLARLHDVVAGSLEREGEAIDEALQATMRFLPRPLRGRAKKMLFPGE